jgi:hypothetical protein
MKMLMTNKKLIKKFWNKASIPSRDDCWNWQRATQTKGYGSVGIGGGKTALAHRVAYEITYGAIPEGMCVLHSCDNRLCVNPKHLFLGTNEDNVRDMVKKGRQARGEKNGRSKLTVRQVIKIRELYKTGDYSYQELTELFPVCSVSIRSIVKEEYWKLPLAE